MAAVVIPYRPRDAFKPLHNRTQRWAVVVAHRRAGKTVACVNELIKAALTHKGGDGRFAYVAPFYSQAKTVAWDYIKHFSRVIPGIIINESELRIDYLNGSRIRLFGADNADALRGQYFDGIVADEYGDWKPSVWGYVIRPALADREGWAIIIGTPKGRNQFFDTYNMACHREEWLALIIRASESGLLKESEMEALRVELSEDAWRQEMECDFDAALPGAYWGKEIWLAEQQKRITTVAHDPLFDVYTAFDIGRRDDTSVWWYQMIANEVRVIDFHSSSLKDVAFYAGQLLGREVSIDFINDEIAVRIGGTIEEIAHRREYNYAKHWLPHDARAKTLASSKSVIEQLSAAVGVSKCGIVPDLSIQDGIQVVRMMLPRMWFDTKCSAGVEALKQYQREYDEDKKCFRDKPRHDWTSHPSDAFRMLAISCRDEIAAKPQAAQMRGITVGTPSVSLDELFASAPKPRQQRY